MKTVIKIIISGCLIYLGLQAAMKVYADSTPSIVINNNAAPAPAQPAPEAAPSPSGCNNQSSQPQGPPPGTYYQSNPHGGTDTVYSTGYKQPYMVDNNCNNNNMVSPVIQPYVNAPGPTPGPTPRR